MEDCVNWLIVDSIVAAKMDHNSTILTQEKISKLVNLTGFSNWNLLYQETRDAFSASSFHSKCNGILNGTLTIVSTNNFSNIFGGLVRIWV